MKNALLLLFLFSFTNCTDSITNTMSNESTTVKEDLKKYLEDLHGEAFAIKSVSGMANVGNPGTAHLYELICYPVADPRLVFAARAGYNKEGNFYVVFEYYQTVLTARKANTYAQPIIKKYYSAFASYATLSRIQKILDEMPPFDLPTYESLVQEHAGAFNTSFYIAVPKSAADTEGHKENLRNLFRDFKSKGHLNVAVTLGFYEDSVKDKMNTDPQSFFDPAADPADIFLHTAALEATWEMDLTERIMPDAEKHLQNSDALMYVKEK